MCQYYRWTCSACRCTQDCLCRCPLAQHHGICARTTEPLALPYDTPSILCQQGGTTRSSCVPSSFAHGAAQPRTLSHRPSPNICGLPEPPIPPMDDIFWLKPIARLPDRTEILLRYDKARSAIFQASETTTARMQHEKDLLEGQRPSGEGMCEVAWDKLRRAVSRAE